MKFDDIEPELIELCYTASPLEMTKVLVNGELRGLETLSLRGIEKRNELPAEVVNVLLIYFYKTFAGKVYNRMYLTKLYNLWLTNNIYTFKDAKRMTELDIKQVLDNV
ncbi:hypothetical protein [Rossellomorea aquimaris]|uniref:hypothetical protein n=1 Tax=Rossellomorea aquimaris TaxID=189382 RepID=UPI0007D07C3B|nr:hypothetical protein [Rossellomorea aquimaris]